MNSAHEKGLWSMYDGRPVDFPEALNYRTTSDCDCCGEVSEGVMQHAAGATGRVCPVLFICDKCKEEMMHHVH